MSNYIPKPNTGTLWPNRKVSDNHPDLRGDVFLDRKFIEGLLRKTDEDLIKVQVACWQKIIANKDCLSVSVSEPYVKRDEPKSDSEDVPF